jgi:hypothetical protein
MEIGFTAGPKPVEHYFKFASDNGFKRLDLGCSAPANFPHTFSEERINDVKALGKKWKIKYGLHTSSYVNTAEIMPQVREASERHLLEHKCRILRHSLWLSFLSVQRHGYGESI